MKLEDSSKGLSYQPFAMGGSGRVNWLSALAGFAAGLVLASVAWVAWLPEDGRSDDDQAGGLMFLGSEDGAEGAEGGGSGETRRVIRGGGGTGSQGAARGGVGVGGGAAGGSAAGDAGAGGAGAVTGNLVKLGATVAEDGIAKAFLGEVRFGMEAVKARVNAAGGIHGRQLQIVYKQDSWDPDLGRTFIENLIDPNGENVFALAVSPSSEGLNAASLAGLFRNNGVPVVGADGLNNTQFLDPWIWPVAAATTTQAHVIIDDAWKRTDGNLHPAIIFGNTYRFGVEGAFAFNQAYNRLSGKDIPGFERGGKACKSSPAEAGRFCGIDASKGQFTSEIATVKEACKAHGSLPKCNFVMLLLEPATALSWMVGFDPASAFEGGGMAGAQPLFTSDFAVECRAKCNGMKVWTGYNPPIGAYARSQAVADYVRALKAQNSQADENNQFTMGGYIGMNLLVKALEEAGRDLTRATLVEKLNSLTLDTGLTNGGLTWTADQRYANDSAQSFRIDYSTKFDGWQPAAPYTKDRWRGQDNRL